MLPMDEIQIHAAKSSSFAGIHERRRQNRDTINRVLDGRCGGALRTGGTMTAVISGQRRVARKTLNIAVGALLVLLVCCSAMTSRAQTETATVSGLITDSQGAIVPNAEVQLQNVARGSSQTLTTNDAGIYVFASVQPGSYQITVRKQGFKQVDLLGMIVNVQDHVEQNFKLELGSVSESITVEGNGLNINTTDGSVSTVIDRQFVENIPLNGRSFQDLIDLTPGVVTQSPQVGGYTGYNGDFSVNGQRTESNNYMVDGISGDTTAGNGNGGPGPGTTGSLSASTALGTTQGLVSVDALQEFRVESSTYSAEYGLSPGGQFSFLTRSGTNTFHGSLFDYFRNDVFDANDWFNDHYGVAKPVLRQNDFGGTLGGPIRLPHLYNGKDRTFFFFSYEGLRLTQPTEATLKYVPSTSLRMEAPSAIQPILNAFPVPTGPEIQIPCDNVTFQCPTGLPLGTVVPSGLAPFLKAYSLPSNIDSILLRIDQQINSRTHAFFRAGYTPSAIGTRSLSQVGSIDANQQTYAGGLDVQLSSAITDEFRIGYSRSLADDHQGLDNFAGAVPINLNQAFGNVVSPTSNSAITLNFSGIGNTAIGVVNPANHQQQWNITNTLSKTVGRHALKAGVSYRRITSAFSPFNPVVEVEYGSPMSILNNTSDFTVLELNRAAVPVYNQFALFGQDEWRVAPNVTLSLGLRWEVEPPPHSENSNKPYPLLGSADDAATYSLGAPGAQLYSSTWRNFAPRLGVAWKVHDAPGAGTVMRAGVGIFYDTGTSAATGVFQSVGTSSYVFPPNVQLPITPAQLDLSFAVTPPYQTVTAVAPNFRLPYTLQWSTALQQAMGDKQSLTLSYVGASGRRLVKLDTITGGNLNPNFTYVELYQNGLTSNYQGLQVEYQKVMSHGLQALASYTWSHSFDYGSSDANFGYIRGNSDFDVRNVLNAAMTWDLPWKKNNAISKVFLDGWGVDGRLFARSGFPVNLQGNYFVNPVTGIAAFSGVNLVQGIPVYLYSPQFPGGREINRNAFASAPANSLGDAPRNFIRGFGMTQINFAVHREFPLFENVKLQFRAEAFNVLNHPNFGYIDPNLGDATFGQATSTLANSLTTVSPLYQQGGARSMQFALKVIF
jgi:hypothetical protein